MRSGMWTVIASLLLVGSAHALNEPIGSPIPLGPRGLSARMRHNPELAAYIARRGYPDWAEEVEVDTTQPLNTHEVRVYYLRLNREIGFNEAFILGRRIVGLQMYERPMSPEMRAWIERVYLTHDPALRAELAADRAIAAAERAERGADTVVGVAEKTERIAAEMEREFHRRVRK